MPLSSVMRRLCLLPLLINKLGINGVVVAFGMTFINLLLIFIFLLAEIILSECFQGLQEFVTQRS
jgi:O-antigen/teichoic acid export membrane protein